MAAPKSFLPLLTVFCALFLVGQPLRAQEEPQAPLQDKPKPAGAAVNPVPLAGIGGQDQPAEPIAAMNPDATPLTGVQNPTLGTPPIIHSYWQPGFQWSGSIQSNPYNQTPTSSWVMNNYFAGNLSLLKAWSGAQQTQVAREVEIGRAHV